MIKVCFTQDPTAALPLGMTINSGDSFCNQSVDMATSIGIDANTCVLAGTTITLPSGTTTVASNTTANMPRPLVLVATDSITIDGKLDATGQTGFGAMPPPGDGFAGCQNGTNPSGSLVGGGGQGGSFIGTGGTGGTGNGGSSMGGSPGPAMPAPTTLHAGCGGQNGASMGASGGGGGGAIYLIAGNSLTISGTGRIDASGDGGSASGPGVLALPDTHSGSGGGGGGSGGMIGLDGKTVAINGAVCAIGGGGSAGWGTGFGGSAGGKAGGTSTCVTAMGGSGQSGGGNGGAGGTSRDGTDGTNGGSNAGGGGGGGSTGYIKIYGTKSGVTAMNVVPQPS